MKINLDPKKGVAKIADLGKDVGQKAVANVQQGAKAIAEKTADDAYQRRLKKYSPLFPDVYVSPEFNVPNVIIIVDDAVRRGIDVCEGAIGWLGKENETEILYLYDEAVPMSGLTFVPAAMCDKAYHMDAFDRSCFIEVDSIFQRVHDNKVAELKYIANSLGAKRCSIETSEYRTEKQLAKKKFALKESAKAGDIAVSNSESKEQEGLQKKTIQRSGTGTIEFEGNNRPTRPELKWFAHDDNIKRLIEMRCNGTNQVKSDRLELRGSSSSTMSQKTACAIDAAVGKLGGKVSAKGEGAVEAQVFSESKSVFIFSIEF